MSILRNIRWQQSRTTASTSRGPEDEEPDDTAITPCNVETLEAADNHVRHASLYVRFQLWFSFQPTVTRPLMIRSARCTIRLTPMPGPAFGGTAVMIDTHRDTPWIYGGHTYVKLQPPVIVETESSRDHRLDSAVGSGSRDVLVLPKGYFSDLRATSRKLLHRTHRKGLIWNIGPHCGPCRGGGGPRRRPLHYPGAPYRPRPCPLCM